MEERRMLSAAPFEVGLLQPQFAPLAVENARTAYSLDSFFTPSKYSEGGFIDVDSTTISPNFNEKHDSITTQYSQTEGTNLDLHQSNTNGFTSAGAYATASLPTSGMKLIRFTNAGSDLAIVPSSNLPSAKLKEMAGPAQEGGAISISTLLADMQREEQSSGNEDASPSTSGHTPNVTHEPVHTVVYGKPLLAGEWARAAVFETVDSRLSDTIDAEEPAPTDSTPDSPHDGSTSSDSDAARSASTVHHQIAQQGKIGDSAVDRNHPRPMRSIGSPIAHRIEIADWHWFGNFGPFVDRLAFEIERAPRGQVATPTALQDELISDAAFEQLGHPVKLESEPTGERAADLTSRNALPLLLIVTLEGIASIGLTSSMRRSWKESVTSMLPRRRAQRLDAKPTEKLNAV